MIYLIDTELLNKSYFNILDKFAKQELYVPVGMLDSSALEQFRLTRIANRVLRERALKANQYSTINIIIRVF